MVQVRLKESPSPYLGAKELSYCALRTQLLMSLHDSSQKAPSSKAAGGQAKERDFLSRVSSSRQSDWVSMWVGLCTAEQEYDRH